MPDPRSAGGGSKRLLWSFALIVLLPAVAVTWLGVRLLNQDRELESKQRVERRELAAERVVAGLERTVAATEEQLRDPRSRVAISAEDDAVIVTMQDARVEAFPEAHLLFTPGASPAPSETSSEFIGGEAFEFGGAHARALAAYRSLAASEDQAIRAGALVRLARTLRKSGRPAEALPVYDELSRITSAEVAGVPANLAARRARAALLAELGRHEELQSSARELQAGLAARRWKIDRGTYDSYARQVRHWARETPPAMLEREALSEAVDWLWHEWQVRSLRSSGRAARRHRNLDVTLLWQLGERLGPGQGEGLRALVAGPRFRARQWLTPITLDRLEVTFVPPGSPAGAGERASEPSTLRRSAADSGLPWTLVFKDMPVASEATSRSRRTVILAGLTLIVLVVMTGALVVARGVSHELDVARLQSNFVSAVSHEFRTPLTSLQQFTSLLNDDEEPPPHKRRAFYQAQGRAVSRLQHLVESLLDFGRMEAGAYPYRLERMAVAPFMAVLVESFRDAAPQEFAIVCTIEDGSGDVTIDRDAVGRAIRNLLENAVKYSGDGRRIEVRVARRGPVVAITVQDDGLGIPRAEQSRIFTKFVRGAASRVHGISGTGIGLAMALEIIRAHHGDISVESVVGSGSTFTVTLPAATAGSHATHRAGSA